MINRDHIDQRLKGLTSQRKQLEDRLDELDQSVRPYDDRDFHVKKVLTTIKP